MKKLCFGTMLQLMYQSRGAGVTYKSICDNVFKAYGAKGMDSYDESLPSHLKTGHDNVPPEVVSAARALSFSDAIMAFESSVVGLVANQKGLIYAVKAVLREDDISDDTLLGYIKGYEKRSILQCNKFQMAPLLASVFKYVIVDIKNHDCMNNLKDFGRNYLSSVDTNEPLFIDPIEDDCHINTDEPKLLQRTLIDDTFSKAFRKVSEVTVAGVTHPSKANIYRVDLTNCKFRFKELKKFMLRNIANYVFSRTETGVFSESGTPGGAFGTTALIQFMKAYKDSSETVLGELLLYAFLEHELNAPKIMSKIEFSPKNGLISKSDGIHLLSISEYGRPFNQLVFGASDITGSLKEAVDRAFDRIILIEMNSDSEFTIVENAAYSQLFDQPTREYLHELLVPRKDYNRKPDMAFGMFLGYTLDLDSNQTDSAQFYMAADYKLNKDIESVKNYIAQKIIENQLEGYTFYCYVLPFNDAPNEKTTIIDDMLEGK